MNVSMIAKATLRWTLSLQTAIALSGLAAGILNAADPAPLAVKITSRETKSEPFLLEIPGAAETSSLKFGKPQNGDTFQAGDTIGIVLESLVPEDYLTSAEVLLNGKPIGYASYCCPACKCQQPTPGAPLTLTVWTGYGGLPDQGWNNPQPGRYKLSAQGTTSTGKVIQADSIEVVIHDFNASPGATLVITAPQDGEILKEPAVLSIDCTATDPNGSIRHVEFLANSQKIGQSDILTKDADIPGKPRFHHFDWSPVMAGKYALTARAVAADGGTVQSGPVVVGVLSRGDTLPVVTVEAIQREALESDAEGSLVYRVSRTGNNTDWLPVNYRFDGTASFGTDYDIELFPIPLPPGGVINFLRIRPSDTGTLYIPAGERSVEIVAHPIPDAVGESDESVVLTLLPAFDVVDAAGHSIPSKQSPPYIVGQPDAAKGVIIEKPSRPWLVITHPYPSDLQEFAEPATIPIRATAIDPQGYISTVEFYANDEKVGQSSLAFFVAPPDGTPVHHAFDWEKVPAGKYVLTARAVTAAGGKLISDPVLIAVHDAQSTTPVVTIEASDRRASEKDPADIAIYDIRRSGDKSQPLEVVFETDGSAKRGVDYVLIPEIMFTPCPACDRLEVIITDNKITFPASQSSVRLGVRALPDDVIEGEESVVVRLLQPLTPNVDDARPPYVVGQPGEDKVSIAEQTHRIPVVTVYAKKDRVKEWDPADELIFKFFRSGDNTAPLSVYFTLGGTATFGSDYSGTFDPAPFVTFATGSVGSGVSIPPAPVEPGAPSGGIITFPAGSSESELIFHPVPDKMFEGDESIVVQIWQPFGPLSSAIAFVQPPYGIGEPGLAKGVIVEKVSGPSIVIQAPGNGDVFDAGADVLIRAAAVDPAGAITHVVFCANGRQIGESTITFIRAPDPGVPIQHEFLWKNPPVGKYELTVKSEAGEARVASNPVIIAIGDAPSLPVITVSTPDGEASEPSPGRTDTATFVLTRAGTLDGPITVFYGVDGTARNGRDYTFLDGDATIPAGVAERRIQVHALPDRFIEGTETVVLTLRPSRSYKIGSDSTAQISILDADRPPDTKATIVVTDPDDNAEFKRPGVIPIRISTFDPNGLISFAEFFANDEKIGEEGLAFPACVGCGPTPGSVLTIPFNWKNAPAGQYKLTARGTSSSGDIILSESVRIVVYDTDPIDPARVLHPADLAPADSTLTLEEIKPYAIAWKSGAKWTVEPNPIPVGYVTRAGALWKGGEKYFYDPNAGSAPLGWVNSPPAVVVPLMADRNVLNPVDAVVEIPRAESGALAQWILPIADDASVQLVIRVLPAGDVRNYAVEEYLPAGVKIVDVSDDGTVDEAGGVIRWGPFFDATPRKVSFAIVGARPETLKGIASFDGSDVGIVHVPLPPTPVRDAAASGGKELSNGLRIAHVVRLGTGAMQLTVVDDSPGTGAGCDMEMSDDLVHWQKIGHLDPGANCGTHLDNDANESEKRYYRVIRRQ